MHFVKQKNLKNWSHDNNYILVIINGLSYQLENTANICHERYMPKIELLIDNGIIQLKYFYAKSPDIVRKINDKFIDNDN